MSIISLLKPSKNGSFYGFTIVQLLVGLTTGVISITLLLRLLINVMEINRQEQAKITTGAEQERLLKEQERFLKEQANQRAEQERLLKEQAKLS